MGIQLTFCLLPLLLPDWLDPEWIITALGNWALWGVAFIIFAECGLFSILPGDSLLFTAGMFVALGSISFGGLPSGWVLALCCAILTAAAILGNVTGYWLGALIGPPIFKPRKGFWGKVFNPKYVALTHDFFEKYGNRALILARFVPLVRTFVTLVAGISRMQFGKFITYTAIGGVCWATGVTVLGYFLGTIPFIHENIEAALVLIVAVSLVPMGIEYLLQVRRKRASVESGQVESGQVESGQVESDQSA
ncbi:MAG: DedA family protein [Propionibacteriaceae bacterium]|jgi:membrane-associated protein|nr:DedA family protein [Propionibacteriaceae bacterium]